VTAGCMPPKDEDAIKPSPRRFYSSYGEQLLRSGTRSTPDVFGRHQTTPLDFCHARDLASDRALRSRRRSDPHTVVSATHDRICNDEQ
jgi:hypothetical protein